MPIVDLIDKKQTVDASNAYITPSSSSSPGPGGNSWIYSLGQSGSIAGYGDGYVDITINYSYSGYAGSGSGYATYRIFFE